MEAQCIKDEGQNWGIRLESHNEEEAKVLRRIFDEGAQVVSFNPGTGKRGVLVLTSADYSKKK